jgi:hypothetical protein
MINNAENETIVNPLTKDEVVYFDETLETIERLNLPHPDYEG